MLHLLPLPSPTQPSFESFQRNIFARFQQGFRQQQHLQQKQPQSIPAPATQVIQPQVSSSCFDLPLLSLLQTPSTPASKSPTPASTTPTKPSTHDTSSTTPSSTWRLVLVPKSKGDVVFSRLEKWDLSLVNSRLSAIPSSHSDARVLRDVKNNLDSNGFLKVDYHYARVYSGRGYSACTKETRSFCASAHYVEDDIVNSFPVLLNQVFNALV